MGFDLAALFAAATATEGAADIALPVLDIAVGGTEAAAGAGALGATAAGLTAADVGAGALGAGALGLGLGLGEGGVGGASAASSAVPGTIAPTPGASTPIGGTSAAASPFGALTPITPGGTSGAFGGLEPVSIGPTSAPSGAISSGAGTSAASSAAPAGVGASEAAAGDVTAFAGGGTPLASPAGAAGSSLTQSGLASGGYVPGQFSGELPFAGDMEGLGPNTFNSLDIRGTEAASELTGGSSGAATGTGPTAASAAPAAGLTPPGGSLSGSALANPGGITPSTGLITEGAPGGGGFNEAANAFTPASGGSGTSAGGYLGKAGDYLLKNPSLALGGAGLALALSQSGKQPPGYNALEGSAEKLAAQGGQLQGYLNTGTLPPGLKANLDAAHQAAMASIRSRYAASGQTGSSAEAQDLESLNATVVSQGAQIATQLASQGISEEEFSTGIYNTLMQTQLAQDAELTKAIAGFSGSLAGAKLPSLVG